MINKNTILRINLYEDYNEFCNKQINCDKCELHEKELINQGYDQPCREVYHLLRIIQEK